MKLFGIILFASTILLNAKAADDSPSAASGNVVVINTELINRLVAEARTNNPALKAAASRVRAATLNVASVRTWEDPMAMFGGSVYSSHGFKPSEDGDLAYGIEQKLPLWGRPQLARRVAEAEISTREAQLIYRFQQLRSDITKALLNTAFAESVVEIGSQDLVWLETTSKTVENKYRAGQVSIADVLQIQNEQAKRIDQLRTERLQLNHNYLALNRLLNRRVDSPWQSFRLPPVAPVIPFSEKLLSLALTNEPQLKVLEQEIKQAEAAAAATRKSRLPDVSFGIEGRQYSGDGGFRAGMFTLRFTLPWVNGDKYQKDYGREIELQRSTQEEHAEQVLMVKEELHHLTVGIEATRREAILQRDEITDRANQALSSRLADWETGHGALRDILDARRMLLESQLMSARAVSEQNQMLAELLLWTGLDNFEALTPLVNEPGLLHHDAMYKE